MLCCPFLRVCCDQGEDLCKGSGLVGEIIVGLENGVLCMCSSTALSRGKENLHEKNLIWFPYFLWLQKCLLFSFVLCSCDWLVAASTHQQCSIFLGVRPDYKAWCEVKLCANRVPWLSLLATVAWCMTDSSYMIHFVMATRGEFGPYVTINATI